VTDLILLEQHAIAIAVEQKAVPLRDGDWEDPERYATPDQLVVAWSEPPLRPRYGAFVPPLAPPDPDGLSARGVVWCPGSDYAYMGFEASRQALDAPWEVFPVAGTE
jgi:hypothetical protein